MGQIQTDSRRADASQLGKFVAQLLVSAGLVQRDAELVSDTLVESNLRGIDSHGVARVPHYLRRIETGSIVPRPEFRFERLAPAASRLDGGHGLGQLAMARATDHAVELARDSGAGWVAVCNSSHCGALSYYGLKIVEAGMIGLVFTHVDPMVLPHGAAEPFCGTNPICVTGPGRDGRDLCLDMATSITPWNSIANAAIEGVAIPRGWAVDETGNDTTDPNAVAALYPTGSYKGSGLGIAIDVLCALLSGAPFGPDIPKMYGDLTKRRLLGGLVGAIDIRRFVRLDTFRDRLDEMLTRLSSLQPAESGERVLFPGEPELIAKRERLAQGIPIGLKLLDEFEELARKHGVPPLRGLNAAEPNDATTTDDGPGVT